VKIAAGWLIENVGLKGYKQGNVSVHDQQALVLVNHGQASQQELLALAEQIQRAVVDKFQIDLNIEPVLMMEN